MNYSALLSRGRSVLCGLLAAGMMLLSPLAAQQSQGSLTGTVKDSSGGVVPKVVVTASSVDTGLKRVTQTNGAGVYHVFALPLGTYSLAFSRKGFQTQVHSSILVQANRTTTVDGRLVSGDVETTVTVSGTPLLNRVDTTNGYILSPSTIAATPLGTGSFTQLATLSPGVSADLLSGSGTNAGLGNQDIWANGQRDTSNSFSFNGIGANNIFNGKSSSSVGDNRMVLNTGENFLAGGQIQTNTSVYDAIGQGLPSPPPETMQELRVNTSMYDASEGANSGAHVEVLTRSGTNRYHGGAYWYRQSSAWNAAPFFYNASPDITQKVPPMHRNTVGATLGGPIEKNKMFFYASYQGVRASDQLNGTSPVNVPLRLSSDRSAATLAQQFGINANQIDPASLKLLQAKLPGGQYFIPSAQISDTNQINQLGYDALLQGASSTFDANQMNGNLDYNFSESDHLALKYYFQNDPTTSPFAISSLAGFGQTLQAGSQVFSLDNTTVLSPTFTWEQRVGFIREIANAQTSQPFTPSQMGINLFGSSMFPGISINTVSNNVQNGLAFGPTSNFANAGVFQNQYTYSSSANWFHGRNNISFGFNWNRDQLNVVNRNDQTATLTFNTFADFLTGNVRPGTSNSALFSGSSNRYYRANQGGAYIQDDFKATSNLTLNAGIRWDYDGPLSEIHGMLTNFYPNRYQYNAATDTIVNDGLVVAGNNPKYGTPGMSASTLQNNQWGMAPRLGLAWSPGFAKNLVVRAGAGMYYDRGQFFTEFSPSAGGGYNGPFGVTLEPPYVVPAPSQAGATLSQPFGATAPAAPSGDPASFAALLPNAAQLQSGNYPAGNQFGPFLFGGYDPYNKLPYSENWSLDLQWQPFNTLAVTVGYTGNHGVHQVLPIPFNQAGIATAQNAIHGQTSSYGYNTCLPDAANANAAPLCLPSESIATPDGGNIDLRVPYLGYSANSVLYKAEGSSNYNAFQFSVNKRLSHGLQLNGSYTWSHALDEGSGLGLFYNGNNPLDPKSGYGTAGFDRTHVFNLSYLYQLPNLTSNHGSLLGQAVDGWGLSGVTTLESGQPYSVYDYSGAVGGIFYSANDYITNPIVPLKSGVTVQQAQLQGTTGVNPGQPVLDVSQFGVNQLIIAPGTSGVPACQTMTNSAGNPQQVCDTFETAFGATGRNIFRGPFQSRFDMELSKTFRLNERFHLKYTADFFNLFNTPSFDTPNSDVSFNPYYANPPVDPATGNPGFATTPHGHLGMIQHTLGSPRFLQMSLHLTF